MKSLTYTLAISLGLILGTLKAEGCGPYYPDEPGCLSIFRCCSPELARQWHDGCRFQDYEKDENCRLWQSITSASIPVEEIEEIVYQTKLTDLQDLKSEAVNDNRFARWLAQPQHREDLDYLLAAKEIEELRDYLNDPWYYGYEGDEEHTRLNQLMELCQAYAGSRHAARYALQIMRLNFAKGDFDSCINLWENSAEKMPRDIVTDMIASYAGGAYFRKGDRDKAIELYTRSQDIGSLMALNAWDDAETVSEFTDGRVKQLEYIFNRFPNSPLLSIKLEQYVKERERFIEDYQDWESHGFSGPTRVDYYEEGDSIIVNDDRIMYDELKRFALKAAASPQCRRKGMWHYGLSYLYLLDNDMSRALAHLNKAEHSESSPFIKESIRALRFLVDARNANNNRAYRNKLHRELKWLDERMIADCSNLDPGTNWQYNNVMNWPVDYWPDVARRVILGEICPRMSNAGNTTLALQLANYASNRLYQLSPLIQEWYHGVDDEDNQVIYETTMPFEEYRNNWTENNYFDYRNQFFGLINSCGADEAAKYATTIQKPVTELDKFLNERGYVDTDYICDIVGTLYQREMNYGKAVEWLSKVSDGYQKRTNIEKEGYFKLDPFKGQFDKKNYIADSGDYKLRFAQEMVALEKMMNSDSEPNRKANARIRYATGLRNSFGKCWYLTEYGHEVRYESSEDEEDWNMFSSGDRGGFKGNTFARKAYKRVDDLMSQALTEFTDPEKAAQANLEMMNFATVVNRYPSTAAAEYVKSRCDNYYDYALQKR